MMLKVCKFVQNDTSGSMIIVSSGIIEDEDEKPKSALHSNKDLCDETLAKEELEIAKNEWQQVDTIVPRGVSLHRPSSPVTYESMMEYFNTTDMTEFAKKIQPEKKRKALSLICYRLFGPPKVRKELVDERDSIFTIAQFPFDNSNSLHIQLLQTLYKNLTGIVLDCPQFGNHWEEIGFQGCNPATDLRGVGFLGLLHLLHFILNSKTKPLAREIYKLSHSEEQHFPFCIMGINVTRITLEALREGCLNREINRNNSAFPTVNDFYSGTFYYLYTMWKEQKKTIMDSGYVIQDVTKYAKKNVKLLLQNLKLFQENTSSIRPEVIEFSDIGDITVAVSAS